MTKTSPRVDHVLPLGKTATQGNDNAKSAVLGGALSRIPIFGASLVIQTTEGEVWDLSATGLQHLACRPHGVYSEEVAQQMTMVSHGSQKSRHSGS